MLNKIAKMDPITLNKFGDKLRECPRISYETYLSLKDYEIDPDKGKLSSCIGIHDVCNSWMDIRQTSETHKSITCRGCGLRIVIPNNIKTFGDLRKYCSLKKE